MPPAASAPRVRDRREAVRHAPAGHRPQIRGPLQQRRPGPVRLRAQPLFFCPPPFPLLSGVPVAFLLPAPGRFRLPCRPPGPRILAHRGEADDLLRLRDRRLGGIRHNGHAKLVTQRGSLAEKRCQIPLVLAGSPLPCPRRDQTAANPLAGWQPPVTAARAAPDPRLITSGNEKQAPQAPADRHPERKASTGASQESP